jgi:hypothetical protein
MWQTLSNYFCPRLIYQSDHSTNRLRFTYKFLTPYLHLSLGCHWTIVTTVQQHYPHFNEFLDNLFNRSINIPINLVKLCMEVAEGYDALIPEKKSATEHFDFVFTSNHIASLTFDSNNGKQKTCTLILTRMLSPDCASTLRFDHNCPNLEACQCRSWSGTRLYFNHTIGGVYVLQSGFDKQRPNGQIFSSELVKFLLLADQWLRSEDRQTDSEIFYKSLFAALLREFNHDREHFRTTWEPHLCTRLVDQIKLHSD